MAAARADAGSGPSTGPSTGPSAATTATAAYTSLLTRIPADVRPTCKDTTGELSAAEKPYVVTRASCTHTIDGRMLDIAYRTVPGDDKHIQTYRNSVLQIGANFNIHPATA